MAASTALTGLNFVHYAPLTTNTDAAYTPGSTIRLEGAMTLSADQIETATSTVAADDDPNWLASKVTNQQSETRQATLGQMSLKDLALFTGAKYNDATSTLTVDPQAYEAIPQFGFSFASKQANNNYRMTKYYACTLNSCLYDDLQTNSGGAQTSNVQLNFTAEQPKKAPSLLKRIKEGPLDMTWLQNFTDSAPDAP